MTGWVQREAEAAEARETEVEEIAAAFDAAHSFQRICDLLGNPEDPEQVVREMVEAMRVAHGEIIKLQARYHAVAQQRIPAASAMKALFPIGRLLSKMLNHFPSRGEVVP